MARVGRHPGRTGQAAGGEVGRRPSRWIERRAQGVWVWEHVWWVGLVVIRWWERVDGRLWCLGMLISVGAGKSWGRGRLPMAGVREPARFSAHRAWERRERVRQPIRRTLSGRRVRGMWRVGWIWMAWVLVVVIWCRRMLAVRDPTRARFRRVLAAKRRLPELVRLAERVRVGWMVWMWVWRELVELGRAVVGAAVMVGMGMVRSRRRRAHPPALSVPELTVCSHTLERELRLNHPSAFLDELELELDPPQSGRLGEQRRVVRQEGHERRQLTRRRIKRRLAVRHSPKDRRKVRREHIVCRRRRHHAHNRATRGDERGDFCVVLSTSGSEWVATNWATTDPRPGPLAWKHEAQNRQIEAPPRKQTSPTTFYLCSLPSDASQNDAIYSRELQNFSERDRMFYTRSSSGSLRDQIGRASCRERV